ncbi:MAG: lipocalin family protein [Bacteroidales bacterium]|nr:lipocalin family protein [Bacteroidales bacterium]
MKRMNSMLAVMALLVTAFCFSACEEETPSVGATNQASILGTWQCSNADMGGLTIKLDLLNSGDKITFNSDNTFSLSMASKQQTKTGSWTLSGNSLKISSSNSFDLTFTVSSLTQTTLVCTLLFFGYNLKFTFDRPS